MFASKKKQVSRVQTALKTCWKSIHCRANQSLNEAQTRVSFGAFQPPQVGSAQLHAVSYIYLNNILVEKNRSSFTTPYFLTFT